jgi:AraC-like DNA-binding protein
MLYRYREIPSLSPLAYVWEYELQAPTRETILPNGFVVMGICLEGPVYMKTTHYSLVVHAGEAVMIGHQFAPFETLSKGYKLLGLQLHPILFRALTGMEAAALANHHIWARDVIADIDWLIQQCFEAGHLDARAEILSNWVQHQLHDSFELKLACSLEQAVERQLVEDPTVSSAIEKMSGYSRAQTYRILKEWFGTAPGAYWRHKKFIHSLKFLHHLQDAKRSGIKAGFYDPPHFSRSFRRFTGMAPSRYVQKMSGFRGHLYDETSVQGT